LLNDQHLSVLAAGSVVRGWSNADSDLDLYVICTDHEGVSGSRWLSVPLQPSVVPLATTFVAGRRCDIEYWLDGQVDQLLDKIGWATLDRVGPASSQLVPHELDFLERLTYAVALTGEDWLLQRRRQLDQSALTSVVVSRSLHHAELLLEDAVGQLRSDDVESAVLSVKLAFGRTVDGLLAAYGEPGQHVKWRARRFHAVTQDTLSFADYWSIETMRNFDHGAPQRWVEDVVRVCRQILREVTV
jgi:hypothetical protein